jgi:hypothetical protein
MIADDKKVVRIPTAATPLEQIGRRITKGHNRVQSGLREGDEARIEFILACKEARAAFASQHDFEAWLKLVGHYNAWKIMGSPL